MLQGGTLKVTRSPGTNQSDQRIQSMVNVKFTVESIDLETNLYTMSCELAERLLYPIRILGTHEVLRCLISKTMKSAVFYFSRCIPMSNFQLIAILALFV